MPKIPTLDGNRVQEANLNISRMNSQIPERAAFGGGDSVARVNVAAERLGQEANRIQKEEQNKADQIAILEADKKLSELETKFLYDRDTGILNKKGKDSFSLPDTVVPEFEKQAQEIQKGLNSDYQKFSFSKMMIDRTKHLNNKVQQHVHGETKRYDEQVTKSYIANEMNAAIESFDDPERVQLAIDRQRGAILSHADRNGLDAETVKQLVTETESKTHIGIISKIVNAGADLQAQKYYKDNKDKIIGEDRLSIEKTLKEGVLMGDSQRIADKIMSKDLGSKDALAEARKIEDPRKRDEVVRRVKQQISDKQFALKADQDANFETAYQAVEANATMDAVPKEVLTKLSLSGRKSLEARAAQLRNGTPVQTDLATYYELEQLAGTPATRSKFLQTNLLEKKHLLSEPDFKHFAGMQKTLQSGKGNKQLDGIETKLSIVNTALSAAGIDYSKKASSDDAQRTYKFRSMVDKLVNEKQEATGKKITNAELREITNNLMVEVITDKGFFFDTKKKVFELGLEDTAMIKVNDIPQDDLEKIRNVLNKLNQPVSDENILKLYTEKINSMTGRNDG